MKPSHKAIAQHLDLSQRTVRDLVERDVFAPAAGLEAVRIAYIRHLREIAAGRASDDGDLDLVAERARLAKEQADRISMENALRRGELVDAAEVEGWLVSLLSGVVVQLRAIPAKAAPEAHGAATIAEVEAVFRRAQDEALEEVASAKWISAPRAERGDVPADAGRSRADAAAEGTLRQ